MVVTVIHEPCTLTVVFSVLILLVQLKHLLARLVDEVSLMGGNHLCNAIVELSAPAVLVHLDDELARLVDIARTPCIIA